jgi:hypothetical protein
MKNRKKYEKYEKNEKIIIVTIEKIMFLQVLYLKRSEFLSKL